MAPFIKYNRKIDMPVGGSVTELCFFNAEYIVEAVYNPADDELKLKGTNGHEAILTGDEAKAAVEIIQKL